MLKTLVTCRFRQIQNRLGRDRPWYLPVLAVLGFFLIPLVAGKGVMAPLLFSGYGFDFELIEFSFWIACAQAALICFRTMESLFRLKDSLILSFHPVPKISLYLYHLGNSLFESLITGSVLACVLIGAGVGEATLGAMAVAAGLVLLSGVFVVTLSFATHMWFGSMNLNRLNRAREPVIGLSGAASFTYSPGVALGVSLAVILLGKLAGGEIHRSGLNRASFIVFGLILVGFLVSIVISYISHSKYYTHLLARFYEADFVVLDPDYTYGESVVGSSRGLEILFPKRLLPLYRKNALQFSRRYIMVRLFSVLSVIAAVFYLWRTSSDSLSSEMLLSVHLFLLFLVINPWSRIYNIRLNPPELLEQHPVTPSDRFWVRELLCWRECLLFSVPVAVVVMVFIPFPEGLSAACMILIVPLLSSGLLSWVNERVSGSYVIAVPVHLVLFFVLSGLSFLSLVFCACGLAVVRIVFEVILKRQQG